MVKKKLLKKLPMRIFAVLMVMVLCMGSMSLNVFADDVEPGGASSTESIENLEVEEPTEEEPTKEEPTEKVPTEEEPEVEEPGEKPEVEEPGEEKPEGEETGEEESEEEEILEDTELVDEEAVAAENAAAVEAFKNAAKIFLDAYEADPYDIETWLPLKEQAEALYKVLVEKDLYNYEGVQELWALVNSKAVMELQDRVENVEFTTGDLTDAIKRLNNGGTIVLIEYDGGKCNVSSTVTLNIDKTYTLDLNGNTLDGGSEKQILRITAGNVTLINGTLTKGKATNGGGVYAGGGAKLTIGENCDIIDNKATNGGGVYAKSSSVTINGGTISDNTATNYGGGVYAYNSSVTISGGTIANNEAQYGGGVYAHTTSPVTINGGEISYNTATESGGGVYAELGSTVTVNDGTIKVNTAQVFGGGVCTSYAAMYIYNGTISQNACSSGEGGGLAICAGSFYMYGGVVSENRGSYGGGIYLYSVSGNNKYEISGGTISNNTALNSQPYAGGGIHVSEKCNLTLKNALVTGNTNSIEDGGGGISGCPTSYVKMFLSDGGAVFGNKGSYEVSLLYNNVQTNDTYQTFFSPFMLGGGLYNWESEQDLNSTTRTTNVYASNNPSDADKGKAKAANESKKGVLISGNTGAGIGTNGSVFFGTAAEEPYIKKYQSVNGGTATQDSQTANVGDTVTYYLTIVNETNESKTVTVTDTVPEGMELVSIEDGGKLDGDGKTITWTINGIDALSTKTVSFKVKVQTDGEITNTGKLIIAGEKIPSNEVIINPPTPDNSDNPSNPDESPSSDNPDDTTTTDGGTTGGGGGETTTTEIAETTVPLSDIPETDVPLADIPDEDIPLTEIPRTGEESLAYILAMMLSGMGLAWLAISEKRKRDSRTE